MRVRVNVDARARGTRIRGAKNKDMTLEFFLHSKGWKPEVQEKRRSFK